MEFVYFFRTRCTMTGSRTQTAAGSSVYTTQADGTHTRRGRADGAET